jgi:hypothetical protein
MAHKKNAGHIKPTLARSFESLIEEIVQGMKRCAKLSDESEITRNEPILGLSGERYSIDVVWKFRVGITRHMLLISAKYWKKRVSRAHVNEMSDIVHDIPGQPRAVIVTSHGVQSGASSYAKAKGIDLWQLERSGNSLKLAGTYRDDLIRSSIVPFGVTLHDANGTSLELEFPQQKIIRPEDLRVLDDGKVTTLETICEDLVAKDFLSNAAQPNGIRGARASCEYDVLLSGSLYKMTEIRVGIETEHTIVDTPKPSIEALFTYLIDNGTTGERFGVGADFVVTDIYDGSTTKGCDICGFPLPKERMHFVHGSSFAMVDKRLRNTTVHYSGDWFVCPRCYEISLGEGAQRLLFSRALLMSDVLRLRTDPYGAELFIREYLEALRDAASIANEHGA